jgi:hypothetical protein
VTWVSRSNTPSPLPLRRRAAAELLLRAWHASCTLLGSGCLYTAPVWRGEVNQPPIVIQPEAGEQDVLLFSDLPVVVVAADPEGDDLVFLWSAAGIPDLPSTERSEGELTTSTAVIPYDPSLDGTDVECLVVDQSEAFNDVVVRFHVEVQ